jgi:hypothetical protein
MSDLKTELRTFSEYAGTNQKESFFLALVIAFNIKGEAASFRDLGEHFNCNTMKVLQFYEILEKLCQKGMLSKSKSQARYSPEVPRTLYVVNDLIMESILTSQAMPTLDWKKLEDIFEILGYLNRLIEQRDNDEITTIDLFDKSETFLTHYKRLPLIAKILNLNLPVAQRILFLNLIWNTLSGRQSVDAGRAMAAIYDHPTQIIKNTQALIREETELSIQELVELEEASFFEDTRLRLSGKSVLMIQNLGIKLFGKKIKSDNIIEPGSIIHKELVFNSQDELQVKTLVSLLEEKNLQKTRKQLELRKLPVGVIVLLYGSPGTGKTELVLQAARETNRTIFKVDISESKSMWFGESQKLVKKIFTDYRALVKESAQMPILLFNEADGLIARRGPGAACVDQTENAIQNIILDELESFSGIFIATTNLPSNMDSAFERRFLFKIELKKPDPSVKVRIWKLKIPSIPVDQCEVLANRFDFSGGQIDNIARKAEIDEILNGSKPDLKRLIGFCEAEVITGKDRQIIGFGR